MLFFSFGLYHYVKRLLHFESYFLNPNQEVNEKLEFYEISIRDGRRDREKEINYLSVKKICFYIIHFIFPASEHQKRRLLMLRSKN